MISKACRYPLKHNIRPGPALITCNTTRLPDRRQNKKDVYPYGPPPPGYERQVILANDENHARLRKIYGPAFTPKAVEEQSGMLLKYADLLVSTLKNAIKQNDVQDMSAWYNFVTFDLTGEFAFDESFHCLDQGGKSHFFVKTVLGGVVAGLKVMQFERWGLWTILEPMLPKAVYQAKVDMDNYTAELVDRRTEKGHVSGKADVLNYLLQNKNEEDRLTRDELVDNGIVLVVAGSETTATLLAGVTWHLCKNPKVKQKVVQEVRSAFESDEDITTKAVNNLPYMLAVCTYTIGHIVCLREELIVRNNISGRGHESVPANRVWVPSYCLHQRWPSDRRNLCA